LRLTNPDLPASVAVEAEFRRESSKRQRSNFRSPQRFQ
jgi:hypothetical protein